MTRNLRTQLASLAERWLNSWGYNLTREQAALLLKAWDLAEPWDDETVAEVLSRFPAAEPPAVPGLDFLPETQADADVLVAETVAALDDFQAYLTVACPACRAAVGELCHGRDSAQWSHINRRNASALVEVVPQPKPAPEVWDGSVPPGGFVCSVCRTPVESEPCELHGEAVLS